MATMSVDTATIRVRSDVRDLLAKRARERGVSLASLLGEIAREQELQAIWDSERQASEADAGSAAVAEERRAWETALADGLG